MANDHYAMIEAPTGTGKTLAYLTAAVHQALRTGQPVALSTAYRNLQDQLLGEIADLQRHGTVSFRSQLLKGVGNYLCWSQIHRYLETTSNRGSQPLRDAGTALTLSERFVLAYVCLWLPGSANGTADEVSGWVTQTIPHANGVLAQLRASASCNPGLQPTCSGCPMPEAYANARQADIIVLNHALWLADPIRLPPFTRLVLDEAHTLEDVATSALTQEVSLETLGDLLTRLYDPRTERGLLVRIRAGTSQGQVAAMCAGAMNAVRRLHRFVEGFGQHLTQFIRRCVGEIDPRYGASLRLEAPPWKVHAPSWQQTGLAHSELFALHLPDLMHALGHVRSAIASTAGLPYLEATLRDLDEATTGLDDQRRLAYDLLKVGDTKLVYWIEVGPVDDAEPHGDKCRAIHWALKAVPIDVGEALQPFYDKLLSISFISATLALNGNDFNFFIDRLGLAKRLDDGHVRKLPAALPYGSKVFLGLTDYLTYAPLQQTMESFKEELAGELSLFLQFTRGRALGLFTARERMEYVATRITPVLARQGVPLYKQTPGTSRRQLLDDFKARLESVLFGLRSFWEGVDAPGETLSFVLMEKLPFPLLTEPVHRARAEHLVHQGKSEFDDYMLPLMLLQFKQGFGRLIRREDDRGAVVLFDKRIHRKDYKAALLNSLPGYMPRDHEVEHSRLRFYRAMAEALPGLIDLEAGRVLLDSLPEDIALNFESTLARYTLPALIHASEYEAMRLTILAALHDIFGHDQFRSIGGVPAQESVVRHVLAGDDVLGVLPTGAGKSLTFQLPALLRDGVTLVFSPLIALMKDQVAGLNEKGIEVVGAIYSGQTASERDDVFERMRRGRVRLVYISPERLRDPQLLEVLRACRVVQVVVDEAHCVYMWGPSFRPDFLYLPRLFDLLGYRPPVAALTATATPQMQDAIIDALRLREPARVVAPIDRPELQFIVYNATSRYGAIHSRNGRFRQLLRILQAADRDQPPILIYVATTVESDQLTKHLQVAGFNARAYHGKMAPADRASVQEMFMDEHVNIIVCTKAFGMGIDKPNIRYVIHYNMPGDLESYFQEAGRAGRDGQPAYCILLYHEGDVKTQEFFIDNGTPDEGVINAVLHEIAQMPDTTLYIDPDALAEHMGLEDTQLRVAIYHLESQGHLTRSTDFTLTAGLTFQVYPEEALSNWRTDGEPAADAFARLLRVAQWPAFRRVEVNLLSMSEAVRTTPDVLEGVLWRLSARGEVVYRPWRRGFVLIKRDKCVSGQVIPPGTLAAQQHRDEMRRKLDAMVHYAEQQNRCRRAIITDYFAQPSGDTCRGCDVCQPEREWPWSLITERDFATPDGYVDPAFTLLETVKWNLDRARRYGATYGTGTLLAVLRGDLFTATRYESDPHLRQWRASQLRDCPYWGVLSVLPSRDRVLQGALDRLLSEGYLQRAQQPRADGAPYEYLTLTRKGINQLTSGRLLQWDTP